MDVPERVTAKLDTGLRRKLDEASSGESLRIVVRLLSPSPQAAPPDEIRTGAFPNRQEYRRELIRRRRAGTEGTFGGVIDRIRKLGVSVYGGGLVQTVVLEGPAEGVVKALDLDEVAHADLDRPLTLDLTR